MDLARYLHKCSLTAHKNQSLSINIPLLKKKLFPACGLQNSDGHTYGVIASLCTQIFRHEQHYSAQKESVEQVCLLHAGHGTCFVLTMMSSTNLAHRTTQLTVCLPLPVPSDSIQDAKPEMVWQITATLGSHSVADFDSACSSCPELSALSSLIQNGWPPSIKSVNNSLAPYCKNRPQLSVKDNSILRSSRLIAALSTRHTVRTCTWGSPRNCAHKTTPKRLCMCSIPDKW